MAWCGLEGHDAVVQQFRQGLQRRRLASTFLFVGPPGIGKRLFAMKLAQALLCDAAPEEALQPCQTCSSCQQFLAEGHPDVQVVRKPPERSFIPVELFIGDREHRMRDGLCHWIALKPAYSRRKIAIIDDADALNVEGANCLLKTLEEPPPRSLLILISTSEQRQLPTIRSRSQIVRFRPLPHETMVRLVQELELARDQAEAHELALLAEGSLQHAVELADEGLAEFRNELWRVLSNASFDPIELAAQISKIVEAAGKEAPARRQRLRNIVGLFLLFYRQLLLAAGNSGRAPDSVLAASVQRAAQHADPLRVAEQLDRCVEVLRQIDANANLATLVDCWIDDLVSTQPLKI